MVYTGCECGQARSPDCCTASSNSTQNLKMVQSWFGLDPILCHNSRLIVACAAIDHRFDNDGTFPVHCSSQGRITPSHLCSVDGGAKGYEQGKLLVDCCCCFSLFSQSVPGSDGFVRNRFWRIVGNGAGSDGFDTNRRPQESCGGFMVSFWLIVVLVLA